MGSRCIACRPWVMAETRGGLCWRHHEWAKQELRRLNSSPPRQRLWRFEVDRVGLSTPDEAARAPDLAHDAQDGVVARIPPQTRYVDREAAAVLRAAGWEGSEDSGALATLKAIPEVLLLLLGAIATGDDEPRIE